MWFAGLTAAAAAFVVYLATLAPTLTFQHWGSDGGDLIAAARTLGIPHPPGYPTYTLMAWLATQLPFGSIAYRANVLSAACTACAVGLLYVTLQTLVSCRRGGWLPAGVASLALGFAPLAWSQAVIAEVYATALCFASLTFFLVIRWRSGGADVLLWLAALVFGLGLGVHSTLAFFLLPALILLWPLRARWRRRRVLLPGFILFAAGLAVFAYLPLAASHRPPVNWGDPEQGRRFLWVVTGALYQPLILGLPASGLFPRLSDWARLVAIQFGWFGWALALLGLPQILRRDRALGIASIAWVGGVALFALLYNSTDSFVYLLPVMLMPALWLCTGVAYLLEQAKHLNRWAAAALSALLLLIPAVSLVNHWVEIDLRGDRSARIYVDQVLAAIDSHGLALVQGDQATFSLWYALYAEGQRQDIVVVNTNLLGFDWYRATLRETYAQLEIPEPGGEAAGPHDQVRELIIRNYLSRPVYALDPSSEWQAWFDIAQEGAAPVYRVLVRSR